MWRLCYNNCNDFIDRDWICMKVLKRRSDNDKNKYVSPPNIKDVDVEKLVVDGLIYTPSEIWNPNFNIIDLNDKDRHEWNIDEQMFMDAVSMEANSLVFQMKCREAIDKKLVIDKSPFSDDVKKQYFVFNPRTYELTEVSEDEYKTSV